MTTQLLKDLATAFDLNSDEEVIHAALSIMIHIKKAKEENLRVVLIDADNVVVEEIVLDNEEPEKKLN